MSTVLFRWIISSFVVFWLLKNVFVPVSVGGYYYTKYQALVVACDTAMDETWFYGEKKLKGTDSVHLLDCHEYDKARKVMLMAGLPESYMSYLGLKALEVYQRPASEFVEHHRFIKR
jgi:His-Xaa-Ser system protein (TIGR03982 family)